MNSEKNQLLLIAGTIGFIAIAIMLFLFVGGEFRFLFIHFSADGVLGQLGWAVPIMMVLIQQLYVLPAFMKGYWQSFSDEPPTGAEVYIPFLNEAAVFSSETMQKVVYGLWVCVGGLVLITALPIIPLISNSVSTASSISFYLLVFAVILFVIICIIRGIAYLGVRKSIYDKHAKYLGVRGQSPYFWAFQMLYFIPIARSISLLLDIQILDKLTKFNDVENVDLELKEEY